MLLKSKIKVMNTTLKWPIIPNQNTPTHEWVFILVQNTANEILYVIEWETKTWKKKYQLWAPCWWVEKWEKPIDSAIRELKEESWLDEQTLKELKLQLKWYLEMFDWYVLIKAQIFYAKLNWQVKLDATSTHEIFEKWFKSLEEIKKLARSKVRPWLFEAIHVALQKKDKYYKHWMQVEITDWEYNEEYFRLLQSGFINNLGW